MIERGLRGSVRLSGLGSRAGRRSRLRKSLHEPVDWQPTLSLLVLDIETAPDASEVFAVSLVARALLGAIQPFAEITSWSSERSGDSGLVRCHRMNAHCDALSRSTHTSD